MEFFFYCGLHHACVLYYVILAALLDTNENSLTRSTTQRDISLIRLNPAIDSTPLDVAVFDRELNNLLRLIR